MTEKVTAGCLCGHIRFEIKGEPKATLQCHCTDCQKSGGGGPLLLALYAQEKLTLKGYTLSGYTVTGESGNQVRRCFCPECGTPVASQVETYPGHWLLRAGIWDLDPGLKPQMVIWTSSAPKWHPIPEDIPIFPRGRE